MTTQELFKELGYSEQCSNDECIEYCKDILDKSTYGYIDSEIISFDFNEKKVYFTNKNDLTYEEVKCIKKQMIELGWNKC